MPQYMKSTLAQKLYHENVWHVNVTSPNINLFQQNAIVYLFIQSNQVIQLRVSVP